MMNDVYREDMEAEARKVKEEFDAMPTRRFMVKMLAFEDGKFPTLFDIPTRTVEIPNKPNLTTDQALDLIFQYGQNDFQPQQMRSVSVGDVVICGGLWMVGVMGFRKLGLKEFYDYRHMDRDARWWFAHTGEVK